MRKICNFGAIKKKYEKNPKLTVFSIISRDRSDGESEYSPANLALGSTLHENGRNSVLTLAHDRKNFSL